MNRFSALLVLSLFLAVSCKPGGEKPAQPTVTESQPRAKTEVDLLVDYLAETGDYVNSRKFPSMIKPETVLESLGNSCYVIDLRKPAVFVKGHIRGAVNVPFSDLPVYFENKIKPYEYDKIVIVCDHGQKSSYATLLLRLMGYGNVYSMRWGMSAWNPDLAGDYPWTQIVSSEFTSKLETAENHAGQPGDYPSLATGKTTGEEIFRERVAGIFAESPKEFSVSAEEVFSSPGDYYIINYERKDKYDSGHVPGAIRYKPGGTLGIEAEMRTIPKDKDVVIYCGTGHNSAFVAAYLRLLGYKAHSMRYGCNSFMHDKMMEDRIKLSWEAFTDDMVMDYPYVK